MVSREGWVKVFRTLRWLLILLMFCNRCTYVLKCNGLRQELKACYVQSHYSRRSYLRKFDMLTAYCSTAWHAEICMLSTFELKFGTYYYYTFCDTIMLLVFCYCPKPPSNMWLFTYITSIIIYWLLITLTCECDYSFCQSCSVSDKFPEQPWQA